MFGGNGMMNRMLEEMEKEQKKKILGWFEPEIQRITDLEDICRSLLELNKSLHKQIDFLSKVPQFSPGIKKLDEIPDVIEEEDEEEESDDLGLSCFDQEEEEDISKNTDLNSEDHE